MPQEVILGLLIDETAQRDAIHVAVAPVVAAESLYSGQEIGFTNAGDTTHVGRVAKPIGIVDPFLPNRQIVPGQRFWMLLFQKSITSLRHVWTHPAFGDEPTAEENDDPQHSDAIAASRKWIEIFSAAIEQTYNRLMKAADQWLEDDEYTYDNNEIYKDHWDKFPDFWKHYEVVTGRKVPEEKRQSFFTCSC